MYASESEVSNKTTKAINFERLVLEDNSKNSQSIIQSSANSNNRIQRKMSFSDYEMYHNGVDGNDEEIKNDG